MKRLLFFLMFAALSTSASADISIVQKVVTGPVMGQPAKNMTLTQYYKGNKSRIDSGPDNYTIIDLDAGKMFIVDKSKKQVTVMTREMLNKTVQMGMAMMGGTDFSVNKTGKTETVNGFKCEEYTVTSKALNMTSCVTQDIDAKELDAFRAFSQDIIGKAMSNLPGVPVKSQSKISLMGQEISGSSEVESISKDSVPDSMFVIPADYKMNEMSVPQMPH
jgi:Domain of unknown function (DUF4412)